MAYDETEVSKGIAKIAKFFLVLRRAAELPRL